jgi:hypothetical protein
MSPEEHQIAIEFRRCFMLIHKAGIFAQLTNEQSERLQNEIKIKISSNVPIQDPARWAAFIVLKIKAETDNVRIAQNSLGHKANDRIESTKQLTSEYHNIPGLTLEQRRAQVAKNREVWTALGLNVGRLRDA